MRGALAHYLLLLLECVLRLLVDTFAQLGIELLPRHTRLDALGKGVVRLGQHALLHVEHLQ